MAKIGIIGAGSAGLLAASELVSKNENVEVTIFEQGRNIEKRTCVMWEKTSNKCANCNPCNIMGGVGGAGTFSSGILNLSPIIGGDLIQLAGSETKAWDLIGEIDDFFVMHGAPNVLFDPDEKPKQIHDLIRTAAAADIHFIPVKQRLIGSENSPQIIKNICDSLEKTGRVKILFNTKAETVSETLTVTTKTRQCIEKTFNFDYLLIAPGRVSMDWLSDLCVKLSIPFTYSPIDIGVRVECPAIIMEDVCEIQRDPKFHIISRKYGDFMRTFCVNHEGYVVRETYADGIVGVNGHSFVRKKSLNTNFAFLNQVVLTRPLEDSTAYGHALAKQTTILGGKNPLVQTLGDLRKGQRSTPARIKKNLVKPTINRETPGDIAMAYPHRILFNILDGLDRLEKVIPGISNDSTLLHAPEIKYSANRVEVNLQDFETNIPGLFMAGDGAGLSRGIVGASLTGILAARGILARL